MHHIGLYKIWLHIEFRFGMFITVLIFLISQIFNLFNEDSLILNPLILYFFFSNVIFKKCYMNGNVLTADIGSIAMGKQH